MRCRPDDRAPSAPTPNDAKAIGKRIRHMRAQEEMSLTELAERAGVSKSYLSTVEKGTGSRPGAAVLHNIAVALGVTLADVLGRNVQPNPSSQGVPESLRAFADQAQLPETDIQVLAGIKFRGNAPRTPERWQFIYNAIVMSARAERDFDEM